MRVIVYISGVIRNEPMLSPSEPHPTVAGVTTEHKPAASPATLSPPITAGTG